MSEEQDEIEGLDSSWFYAVICLAGFGVIGLIVVDALGWI